MDFDSILNGFCWHSQLIPHDFFNVFMLQGIAIMTDAASRRIFSFLATSGACPPIENCLASLELYRKLRIDTPAWNILFI